jgi:molybdate transport system substrate-binding protein
MRVFKVLGALALLLPAVVAPAQTKPGSGSGTAGSQTPPAIAGSLHIAAAADLAPALESIITEFKKSQGGSVKVTYDASGTLATQIEKGVPFDVFMSADTGYPKRLIEKKLANPKTLKVYARGRLVLYILPSVSQDVMHVGLKALRDPKIEKIAIANPDNAPYGRAAVAALKKVGVYDQIQSKLVIAENVGKAAEMVRSGSAQAGIIALTAMHDREMRRHGRVVEVNMEDYPPLIQAAVVTRHGANNPLATVFVQYLSSQMAQGYFARFSYMPPPADSEPSASSATRKHNDKASDKKKIPATSDSPKK